MIIIILCTIISIVALILAIIALQQTKDDFTLQFQSQDIESSPKLSKKHNLKVNKWSNIDGVIIEKIEDVKNINQIKIYDGGPMGDQNDLKEMIEISDKMKKLGFNTYCPAEDGFPLIDALKEIEKSGKNVDENKYYLYTLISSIDFYQLLADCQVAFFNLKPYWSDSDIDNIDNGTIVEVGISSSANKHRVFYKECDTKSLADCLKTTTDCNVPTDPTSTVQSCRTLEHKGNTKNFPVGSCVREMGGNNAYNGWDNPMLLALSIKNRFQTGPNNYAYSDLESALNELINEINAKQLVTYKMKDHGTGKYITYKILNDQMPIAALSPFLINQVLLGYHLNKSLLKLGKKATMMTRVRAVIDVIKNYGIPYYGIEKWNKFKCATIA